jgi:hypothetical protein
MMYLKHVTNTNGIQGHMPSKLEKLLGNQVVVKLLLGGQVVLKLLLGGQIVVKLLLGGQVVVR